ncbi:molybdopterin converting factor subunit 1 [Alkalihalobacterium alkalinitrilicum]|uniref:molybdopterin converting factor subunit 1 n=1 Tax=Alkalihalobacterium alkalinitrilicum TaxID=427920 RepID=UPI0009950653|nr:molybdopterin converting factor subunit 1 [Alkalihalobacterium alkalinitrilicum]
MIKILLFAAFEEAIGQRELCIEGRDLTLVELKEKLSKEYSLPSLDNVMIAVNEEFVEENRVLKENDVIAIIPPVSGG